MNLKTYGNVRSSFATNYSEGDARLNINSRGDLCIAQGLPPNVELSRLGGSYFGKQATSVVCLTTTALPTTVAAATLFNGESNGGKSYIVTAVGMLTDTSAGAAAYFQCFAETSILPLTTAPATTDVGNIRALAGGKVYGGKANIAKTVTVTDNGWIPVGPVVETALTATIGRSCGGLLYEPFIVPPGYLIAVAVNATNATAAGKCFFYWHEVQLDLGV
jgi:hypothetical protein